MIHDQEPSTDSNQKNIQESAEQELSSLRQLLVGKNSLKEIFEVLEIFLAKLEEEKAIDFIKNASHHFGIAALLDSPLAEIEVTEEQEFLLKYPVSELFLNSSGNELSFSGACQDLQKTTLVVLMAMTGDFETVEPLRQWFSFNEDKDVDYYHYFLGSQQNLQHGFKADVLHTLDLSKFFSNLAKLRGYSLKSYGLGMTEPYNRIAGENNLSQSLQPYYEIENDKGVALISVGLRKTEQVEWEATITLEFIANDNQYAPSILIELAFDLDHPENLLRGVLSKFEKYEGWTKGCKYSNQELESLDQVPEEFKTYFAEAKVKLLAQLKRLNIDK